MTYLLAIKTAVILFPLLAFLITGPFILYQYHKYTSISPLKTLIIYSFIFYLLCAYFLVILPLPSKDSVINNPDWMIQMIPFHFIVDLIKENPLILGNPKTYISAILDPSFYVVAFNILLFVPFGMFLKYYKGYSLKKIILASLLLSAFFEFTQLTRLYGLYPKPYRLCDIDDLILNTMVG
ncbi:MAG TPA: VanZ family protein [Candidatus Faecimonas intestinavium]|nr:VanZ family protein [Candidatus Faecimonas intestinavium]